MSLVASNEMVWDSLIDLKFDMVKSRIIQQIQSIKHNKLRSFAITLQNYVFCQDFPKLKYEICEQITQFNNLAEHPFDLLFRFNYLDNFHLPFTSMGEYVSFMLLNL